MSELTTRQRAILETLANQPTGMMPFGIAKAIGAIRGGRADAGIRNTLRALERRGLTKRRNPLDYLDNDRWQITPAGQAQLKRGQA